MNTLNTNERYGSIPVAFHWDMFLLIAAVYSCMELRDIFSKGSDPRLAMITWHFMLGLSVLILATLRLILNVTSSTPLRVPDSPKLQKLSAKFMRMTLYVP